MDKKKVISNLKGLTGNIQEQINGKANANHTHEGLGGAPEGHTHISSEITDLQDKLNTKANVSHQHLRSEITGLESALSDKANYYHTHKSSDISDLDLNGKADKKHSHQTSEISGLDNTLSNKSDNGHNHSTSDVIGLDNALRNKADLSHVHSEYASSSHSHSNYANSSHTHTIANISGLQGEIDGLKSSVSSGKNSIASAITSKGVSATGSEDFNSLSNKIKQIVGEGSVPILTALELMIKKVRELSRDDDRYANWLLDGFNSAMRFEGSMLRFVLPLNPSAGNSYKPAFEISIKKDFMVAGQWTDIDGDTQGYPDTGIWEVYDKSGKKVTETRILDHTEGSSIYNYYILILFRAGDILKISRDLNSSFYLYTYCGGTIDSSYFTTNKIESDFTFEFKA